MQVLLRWGLQKGCLVILKSMQPARVAEWTHARLHSSELSAAAFHSSGNLQPDNVLAGSLTTACAHAGAAALGPAEGLPGHS